MPHKDPEARRAYHASYNSEHYPEYYAENAERIRERARARAKESARKLRNEALDHYGRECACCGEDEVLFLELDHVDGGGNAHRREAGAKGGSSWHRFLKKAGWPPGIQALCSNCNQGKSRNGGVCPHQKEVVS